MTLRGDQAGLRDRGGMLLPAASGVLLALSFPPVRLVLTPFVALVPFGVWIAGLPVGVAGAGMAARGGALLGAIGYGALLHWVYPALSWVTPWALPAFIALVLLLSSIAGLVSISLHRAVHGFGVPLWIALPLGWTAGEWLRAHLPGSLAFPWLGLGVSMAGFPELLGIAEIVGPAGITLWLAAVNGLVAAAIARSEAGARAGRWARLALVATLLVGGPAWWGFWRAENLHLRPVGLVGAVRTDVRAEVGLDPTSATDASLRQLEEVFGATTGLDSARFVVAPEGLLRSGPSEVGDEAALGRVVALAAGMGVPILFGRVWEEGTPQEGTVARNSVFLAQPEGMGPFRYDKRHLVPWVERAPPPLRPGVTRAGTGTGSSGSDRDEGSLPWGRFRPGTELPVTRVGGLLVGTLICYEATFPTLARALRREGAELLVNLSNDAWYAAGSWGGLEVALEQHAAHLVLRAVENRVGVVRAANGGPVLFVDPVGRVQRGASAPGGNVAREGAAGRAELRLAQVTTTDARTLYARTGDLVGSGAAIFVLLLWLGRPRPRH